MTCKMLYKQLQPGLIRDELEILYWVHIDLNSQMCESKFCSIIWSFILVCMSSCDSNYSTIVFTWNINDDDIKKLYNFINICKLNSKYLKIKIKHLICFIYTHLFRHISSLFLKLKTLLINLKGMMSYTKVKRITIYLLIRSCIPELNHKAILTFGIIFYLKLV